MAHSIHHVELNMPIKRIWNFVSDMNNWAPLVPGYAEHEIINDRQSIWKLHGDIGVVQKDVNVKVKITEWIEPSHITFQLSGSSENWIGGGYFKAIPLTHTKTQIIGSLNITVKGMMGAMVNPVLKTVVPKVGKEFTEKVAAKIAALEKVTATV
ncbi:CoxG family protein [Oceanobacillus polygoni]|uniref:Carbon monoxide dehydrogenase subunit G n=1 Tax=Oceanobacillus polygoni TaxID=1235259 RepID=A0A9X0YWG0_9BACI|nr:SRPBCC family protein [Oceanobacillus polygoni]MBP2080057.1 carbon monoxide dehydrogenase subunit G [Oceanobacillus polygoni]